MNVDGVTSCFTVLEAQKKSLDLYCMCTLVKV